MQFGDVIQMDSYERDARVLHAAGYEACDFNGPANDWVRHREAFLLSDGAFDERYARAGEAFRAAGLRVRQVHGPYHTIPDDERETPAMRAAILRSVRATSRAGGEVMVIHPAQLMHWKPDANPEKTRAYNRALFSEVLDEAHKWNVKIALENMPGAGIPTGTPECHVDYIDMMRDPDFFGACFDSGHANVSGISCGVFVRALGERLMTTHLHDNRGRDEHMALYMGSIDWDDFAEALRDVRYGGTFSFESDLPRLVPPDLRFDAEAFQLRVGKALCEKHGLL